MKLHASLSHISCKNVYRHTILPYNVMYTYIYKCVYESPLFLLSKSICMLSMCSVQTNIIIHAPLPSQTHKYACEESTLSPYLVIFFFCKLFLRGVNLTLLPGSLYSLRGQCFPQFKLENLSRYGPRQWSE